MTTRGAVVSAGLVSLLAASAGAAPFEVKGNPGGFRWSRTARAYVIPAETGLEISLIGPAAFILELRSKKRGKRVIVDLFQGEKNRSRNPVKLKAIGGGRKGYRFAALLALRVGKSKPTYRIQVQGANLVVIISKHRRFYSDFGVRPFENLEASKPEDSLVAAPPPPRTVEPTKKVVDEFPDEPKAAGRDADVFAASGDELVEETFEQGEEAVLDAPALTGEDAAVRLAIADDILAIGGRLYSELDVAIRPPSDSEEYQVDSTTLLDVYLDARPLEFVRGYARGRMRFVPTIGDTTAVTSNSPQDVNTVQPVLDQLWLKLSLARTLFITFGQQPIKWGAGRFWNPTDFINSDVRAPLDVVDERTGVPLLKLHLPIESLGWNFYALVVFDGVQSIDDIGVAFRAEIVLSTMELALSTALRADGPQHFGADISAGIFSLDLRAEVSLQYGLQDTFWSGDLSLDPENQRFPAGYQRAEDLIFQAMVGAELPIAISDTDNIVVGFEYFFNDAGYASADLYTWLALRNELKPLYVGRQYAGFYVSAQGPFSWDDTSFVLTTLANVSDDSWLVRLDSRVLLFSVVNLAAFVTGHLGRRGEFRLGIKIPAQTSTGLGRDTVLERGIWLRPAWVTFGLGVLIDI